VIVREKSKFKGFLLENLNEQLKSMGMFRLIFAATKHHFIDVQSLLMKKP